MKSDEGNKALSETTGECRDRIVSSPQNNFLIFVLPVRNLIKQI